MLIAWGGGKPGLSSNEKEKKDFIKLIHNKENFVTGSVRKIQREISKWSPEQKLKKKKKIVKRIDWFC